MNNTTHQISGLFINSRIINNTFNFYLLKVIYFIIQWATDLAQKLFKIHEEEVTRRQEFNSHFDDHFLKSLFPGMTDLPPPFATQAPQAFDIKLPQLTSEDVVLVSKSFPDLVVDAPIYDMDNIVKFFQQRFV